MGANGLRIDRKKYLIFRAHMFTSLRVHPDYSGELVGCSTKILAQSPLVNIILFFICTRYLICTDNGIPNQIFNLFPVSKIKV